MTHTFSGSSGVGIPPFVSQARKISHKGRKRGGHVGEGAPILSHWRSSGRFFLKPTNRNDSGGADPWLSGSGPKARLHLAVHQAVAEAGGNGLMRLPVPVEAAAVTGVALLGAGWDGGFGAGGFDKGDLPEFLCEFEMLCGIEMDLPLFQELFPNDPGFTKFHVRSVRVTELDVPPADLLAADVRLKLETLHFRRLDPLRKGEPCGDALQPPFNLGGHPFSRHVRRGWSRLRLAELRAFLDDLRPRRIDVFLLGQARDFH
jgi:hypothetical protein